MRLTIDHGPYKGTRAHRLMIITMFIVLSSVSSLRAEVPPKNTRISTSQQTYSTYCGIQSLHRAMLSLDMNLPFESLVVRRYIGTQKGSSLSELRLAAKENGLYTLPLYHATTTSLSVVTNPTLLHVKSDPGNRDFDHWVLFMGIEKGTARICDGFKPMQLVTLADLGAIWDGNGLVVSNKPISASMYYAVSVVLYGCYLVLALICLKFLRQLEARIAGSFSQHSSSFLKNSLATAQQAGVLLALPTLLVMGYNALLPQGFLASHPAIESIQSHYVFTAFYHVNITRVSKHLKAGDVVFVDARFLEDYERGHLPRAINIPPNSTTSQCAQLLTRVGPRTPIVIYCQSLTCPFSKLIGKKLHELGFENLSIFDGGWMNWKEHTDALQGEMRDRES
ncbi:Rhodanese-related sulfurtransferase [Singulisphaera sp. GP187]|uniref:rhodanese-like domain-containing protein n=1 Tax=Singulisphaera sp. GP187 TaxID=1882752 RepID=UPI00092600F8|nr:rhodanese-like domain-containing protein [Singulisphaera sp. GP187]SIO10104.1 Rhodanese-related sulfurtransferase [Singulisphaera sp. GP187]